MAHKFTITNESVSVGSDELSMMLRERARVKGTSEADVSLLVASANAIDKHLELGARTYVALVRSLYEGRTYGAIVNIQWMIGWYWVLSLADAAFFAKASVWLLMSVSSVLALRAADRRAFKRTKDDMKPRPKPEEEVLPCAIPQRGKGDWVMRRLFFRKVASWLKARFT